MCAGILGSCFPYTTTHKFVLLMMMPVGCFFMICGAEGFHEILENPNILLNMTSVVIPLGVIFFVGHLTIVLKVNTEFLKLEYEKLQNIEEHTFMLDILAQSIIIIQKD